MRYVKRIFWVVAGLVAVASALAWWDSDSMVGGLFARIGGGSTLISYEEGWLAIEFGYTRSTYATPASISASRKPPPISETDYTTQIGFLQDYQAIDLWVVKVNYPKHVWQGKDIGPYFAIQFRLWFVSLASAAVFIGLPMAGRRRRAREAEGAEAC